MNVAVQTAGIVCVLAAAGVGVAMSAGVAAAAAEPTHEFVITNNTNIDVTLMEFIDVSRPCAGSTYPDVGSLLRAGGSAVFRLTECSTTVKPKYQGTGPDNRKALFKPQMKNGQNNYSAGCTYVYGHDNNAFYACGPVYAEGVDQIWMGGTGGPGLDRRADPAESDEPTGRLPLLRR